MKEQLLASAQKITSPSVNACEEFSAKIDALVAKGNTVITSRSDFEKLVGTGNHEMAENNNNNFARFMESMFSEYDPVIFVETVLWVFRAYRSHGFQTTYWAANLDIWLKNIEKDLSEETFTSLAPFYKWLIVNIPLFVKITDEDLAEKCEYSSQEIAAKHP